MPTTTKENSEARISRETDMQSDIENLYIMLHNKALVNHDVNSHSNPRED